MPVRGSWAPEAWEEYCECDLPLRIPLAAEEPLVLLELPEELELSEPLESGSESYLVLEGTSCISALQDGVQK